MGVAVVLRGRHPIALAAVALIALCVVLSSCGGGASAETAQPVADKLLSVLDLNKIASGSAINPWTMTSSHYLSACMTAPNGGAQFSVAVSFLNSASNSLVHERLSTMPRHMGSDFVSAQSHYIVKCFDAPNDGLVLNKAVPVSASCLYSCAEYEVHETLVSKPNYEQVIIEAHGSTGLIVAMLAPSPAAERFQSVFMTAQAKIWLASH
jgi:hypothetical protein